MTFSLLTSLGPFICTMRALTLNIKVPSKLLTIRIPHPTFTLWYITLLLNPTQPHLSKRCFLYLSNAFLGWLLVHTTPFVWISKRCYYRYSLALEQNLAFSPQRIRSCVQWTTWTTIHSNLAPCRCTLLGPYCLSILPPITTKIATNTHWLSYMYQAL